MLQNILSGLSEKLVLPFPGKEFLPPCGDGAWSNLSAKQKDRILQAGAEAASGEIPLLPAALYRDFHLTGNRSRFEKPYFARRAELFHLVQAYCLENSGEYLERIIDYLDAICSEWTWVVPAHNWPLENPFPPVEPPRVDLFAANTSSLLALTVHLLEEPLQSEAARLVERVENECRRRCLKPYMEYDNHWWMGYIEDPNHGNLNNWNPWITDNYLHTLFLIEKDEAILRKGVARAGEILNHYLNVLSPDGGCDEGPSYWDHAVGSLYDCLEILHWACGRTTELMGDPFLARAASYIYRMHILDDYFINYADCIGRLDHMPAGLIRRMGVTIGDTGLLGLASLLQSREKNDDSFPELEAFSPQRKIRNLEVEWNKPRKPAADPLSRDFFPDIQIGVVRNARYVFSCKGGHNDESHNHNDVGQFILYGLKAPLLIDPGVGDYTRETFSKKRYRIWTMQSSWHNLPSINGFDQREGKAFRCGRFEFDREKGISLAMEEAYPVTAGILSWTRSFTWEEETMRMREKWDLKEGVKEIVWNFISLDEPEISRNIIGITNPRGERLLIEPGIPDFAFEKEFRLFPRENEKLKAWKREGLWRSRIIVSDFDEKSNAEFLFTLRSGI